MATPCPASRALAAGLVVFLVQAAPAQATRTQATPAQDGGHVHTDRTAARLLPLPKQDDCFYFIVYGDRTGGQPEGLKVLEEAVRDTNLLGPDLVMTVGDLVQGYNRPNEWLPQMREFKAIMDRLEMPWFPVAGNHDVYTRLRPRAPLTDHNKENYEKHFGPLWYSFAHKRSAFVVLYSDEGEPGSRRVGFDQPRLQKMSEAQFGWLRATLERHGKSEHVFVFLHHPRWRKGGYGDDWDRVHKLLVAAGNVSAVFAGHIHHIVYGGARDGIEYHTLATTGGSLSTALPERAGYVHHFNLVTVRRSGFKVATIPVGTVLDPKTMTDAVVDEVRQLNGLLRARGTAPLEVAADGAVGGEYRAEVANPTTRPIEVTLTAECRDPRWAFRPDHQHATIPPGASREIAFAVERPADGIDPWFAVPQLRLQADYLATGVRISLRPKTVPVALRLPPFAFDPKCPNGCLAVRGAGHLTLAAGPLRGAQAALTVEAWVRTPAPAGVRSVVRGPGFALQLADGVPAFALPTGAGKTVVTAAQPLEPGRWHHLAGVLDAGTARLYVGGTLAGERPVEGAPKPSGAEVRVGGKVAGGAAPPDTALFVDAVRVSTAALFRGPTAQPDARDARRPADAQTALLLHLDRDRGPWVADFSRRGARPRRVGDARCVTGL